MGKTLGKFKMREKFGLENLKERDQLGDLSINGRDNINES
jgi:hypothetical protein